MDDHQVQRGQQWLVELLRLGGVPCSVHANAAKVETEGSIWLTIDETTLTSAQVERLIGEHGAVLDAIQYLANTTLNIGQPEQGQTAYTIELSGYRVQRQEELQALAEEAVQTVRETGEEYEMPNLSAAERRQVHTYLKAYEDLGTYSRGREPDRRLVVRPA
jgi:spoIIIJ-associated protein